MKIYTRKGDDGSTGLLYGGRVQKDEPAIEAKGAGDEAQERRLADAVGADQSDDAVRRNIERDPVEGNDAARSSVTLLKNTARLITDAALVVVAFIPDAVPR